MIEVKLPQTTDEPMDSVVILWYKAEGDLIEAHDVLVEVQTEKATFEVEAPVSGVVKEIRVKRAETASIGDTLAVIEEDACEASAPPGKAVVSESPIDEPADTTPAGDSAKSEAVFVQAPPRMRRLAAELGVDLTQVRGTGANGRITEADVRAAVRHSSRVEAAAHVRTVSAQRGETVERPIAPTLIRQTTARRMMQSLQQSAQLTLHAWADVTRLAERQEKLAQGVGWTAWVLRAVALGLKAHPVLNASWSEGGIVEHENINLGLAVDTEFGLVVPVISDAANRSARDLQAESARLAEMVRSGTVPADSLSGGTFTITTLGAYGVEFFTPILNPPQAGILGVGAVEDKVVPVDHGLTVIRRMPLSLTFDHRVTDGGPAARFLQAVAANLERPEGLD